MKQYAVIVAGGSGERMGGGLPKQFRPLKGRPVLWWSMKAFHDNNPNTELILVLPEKFISLWKELFDSLSEDERFEHTISTGGNSRTDSVKNGLSLIKDDNSIVAVHDGARPLVKSYTIQEGWNKAKEFGAAIPAVALSDSIRMITEEKSKAVDRNNYVAVQTPQVFMTSLLKKAYEVINGNIYTDDATAVESIGREITLFEGSADNIKITHPKDLLIAEAIMETDA